MDAGLHRRTFVGSQVMADRVRDVKYRELMVASKNCSRYHYGINLESIMYQSTRMALYSLRTAQYDATKPIVPVNAVIVAKAREKKFLTSDKEAEENEER
jgi:hypothetical protein